MGGSWPSDQDCPGSLVISRRKGCREPAHHPFRSAHDPSRTSSRRVAAFPRRLHRRATFRDPPSRPRRECGGGAPRRGSVVMSGLDNPRGLAWGPEGALYVAEAGNGGTTVRARPFPAARTATAAPARSLGSGTARRSGSPADFRRSQRGARRHRRPAPPLLPGTGQLAVTIGWAERRRPAPTSARRQGVRCAAPRGAERQWKVGLTSARSRERRTRRRPGRLQSLRRARGARATFVTDAGGNSLLRVAPNGDVSLVAVFPSIAVPRARSIRPSPSRRPCRPA